MSEVYGIKLRVMYYVCMIEILGRDGLLDEVIVFIRRVFLKLMVNMWVVFLNVCRMYGNLEFGRVVVEKFYGMEFEKFGNYVVMYNVYNSMGRIVVVVGVLDMLESKGLRMMLVCIWVEVGDQIYSFILGDKCDFYKEVVKR